MTIYSSVSSSSSSGSFTSESIEDIWADLYPQLVNFARNQRQTDHGFDSEDIAISAMGSALQNFNAGLLEHDRQLIWLELQAIALRKIRRSRPDLFSRTTVVSNSMFESIPELAGELQSTVSRFVETLREPYRSIFNLKLDGRTNREVAEQLEVSEPTIKRHLRQIKIYLDRWDEI